MEYFFHAWHLSPRYHHRSIGLLGRAWVILALRTTIVSNRIEGREPARVLTHSARRRIPSFSHLRLAGSGPKGLLKAGGWNWWEMTEIARSIRAAHSRQSRLAYNRFPFLFFIFFFKMYLNDSCGLYVTTVSVYVYAHLQSLLAASISKLEIIPVPIARFNGGRRAKPWVCEERLYREPWGDSFRWATGEKKERSENGGEIFMLNNVPDTWSNDMPAVRLLRIYS